MADAGLNRGWDPSPGDATRQTFRPSFLTWRRPAASAGLLDLASLRRHYPSMFRHTVQLAAVAAWIEFVGLGAASAEAARPYKSTRVTYRDVSKFPEA